MEHHPVMSDMLTRSVYPDRRPWQAGSLTGAVASQKVTEAPQGCLSLVGNQAGRVRAEGSLTVRPTGRAGTKVGPSDPLSTRGRGRAHRIKATLGITGLSCPSAHSDGKVWHLDVGSSHPGAGLGPKGWAVRPLKRHASWVQNVARQFGLYPSWACGGLRGAPPS